MPFSIKTWVDRIAEFPNRRKLDSTGVTDTYDVTRSEGTVTQEGDKFNAATMNDLEGRISSEFSAIEGGTVKVGAATQADSATGYTVGGAIDTALQSKAKSSTAVSATLTAAGWTGSTAPYTQTLAVAGLGATQNGEIGVADGASDTVWAAAEKARLRKSGQVAGSLTVNAYGTKPTVDIPVTVTLFG